MVVIVEPSKVLFVIRLFNYLLTGLLSGSLMEDSLVAGFLDLRGLLFIFVLLFGSLLEERFVFDFLTGLVDVLSVMGPFNWVAILVKLLMLLLALFALAKILLL